MPDPISLPSPLLENEGPQDRYLVRKVHLDIVEGPNAGDAFSATNERMTIGSGEGCDVRLQDTTVSRFHCELIVSSNGTVRIHDLGSRNGTLIDGVWVERGLLHHGAIIALGNSRLRFSADEGWMNLPVLTQTTFFGLVGQSQIMRRVFHLLRKAAASDTSVLLEGELSTGKEAAAAALHQASGASGPLVVVDCAALGADAAEIELFGHVAGFRPHQPLERPGALEIANGGTLVLKNVDQLTMGLQKALSTYIETRQVQRLGAAAPVTSVARIVGTTNRALCQEVNHGRFRTALYRQLAATTIVLPPLRDRLEDLATLTEALIATMDPALQDIRHSDRFPRLMAKIEGHRWPGNIAELQAYLRKVVRSDGDASISHFMGDGTSISLEAARAQGLEKVEKRYLEQLLRHTQHDLDFAARVAGIGVGTLQHLLAKHGVK